METIQGIICHIGNARALDFEFCVVVLNQPTMTRPQSTNSIEIKSGPSGRAMAQAMETDLVEALQQHLNLERRASSCYFAMAIWCSERELRGFSSFLIEESKSEQEHASEFADYLIARGQTAELHDLPAPRQTWISPEEIMAASFQMEADVTTSLHQLYFMAERCSDVRTTIFLDPTIENQIKSEHQFAHLLGRVRFAQNQPAPLLIIDDELSENKTKPSTLR